MASALGQTIVFEKVGDRTLSQLAFNLSLFGYALDDATVQIPDGHTFLRVLGFHKAPAKGMSNGRRPTGPNPIPAELNLAGSDTIGLFVGYAPAHFEQLSLEHFQQPNITHPFAKYKTAGKGTPINAYKNPSKTDDFRVLPFKPNSPKVVARLEGNTNVTFHILLDPNPDGVCTAYKIEVGAVFFFERYRDDQSKANKTRQQETVRKVKEVLARGRPGEELTAPVESSSSPADSTWRLPGTVPGHLTTTTVTLTNIALRTRLLQDARRLLTHLNHVHEYPHGDQEYQDNAYLIKLMDGNTPLDPHEYSIVLQQWQHLTSDLDFMDPSVHTIVVDVEVMKLIDQSLAQAHLVIPFRYIRVYVFEFAAALDSARRQARADGVTLVTSRAWCEDTAEGALEYCKQVLGMSKENASDMDYSEGVNVCVSLAKTVAMRLKHIANNMHQAGLACSDELGPVKTSRHLLRVLDQYGNTHDHGGAMVALKQFFEHALQEMGKRMDKCEGDVLKVVDEMEGLANQFQDADEYEDEDEYYSVD